METAVENIEVVNNKSNSRRRLGKRSREKQRRAENKAQNIPEVSIETFTHYNGGNPLALQRVVAQLGYAPLNIVQIVAGTDETPLVALLYPLNANIHRTRNQSTVRKPFPTIFWMIDQQLKARISKLEDEGWIQVLEMRLREETAEGVVYREQMRRAHQLYAEERWSMLSDEDKIYIESQNWTSALRDVGIAGMVETAFVKCLHCNYSHFLARPEHGNLLGLWTQQIMNGIYADTQA